MVRYTGCSPDFFIYLLSVFSYELQLDNHVQRKGLGKIMMQILELMAFKNNMKKVVLTVLKNNNNSKFFKAIG